MSQLLKHYYINRNNGQWATNTSFGLMMPNIKELNIIHQLFDENEIPFCLSTCPEYFEYVTTVSLETLTELQNNPNITIISSIEREEEVFVVDPETQEQTEETTTITAYDIVYQEVYNLQEDNGLQLLSQQEWDSEIVSYDARQEEKRLEILREYRNNLLKDTDWFVIKCTETNVGLSTDFTSWRQSLRDLPQNLIQEELPPAPEEVFVNQIYYVEYAYKIRSIPMINDPLLPLPNPELLIR